MPPLLQAILEYDPLAFKGGPVYDTAATAGTAMLCQEIPIYSFVTKAYYSFCLVITVHLVLYQYKKYFYCIVYL